MASSTDFDQANQFLEKYRNFLDQRREDRLEQFQTSFGHLSTALRTMFAIKSEYERYVTSAFNIFRILDVAHLEVKTHSRFLAELFDPTGSHGQGTLFLEAFLRHDPISFDEQTIRTERWEIEQEKSTCLGNLDIVISNFSARAIVVIENKIYAGDQKDQLKRYDEWLINHRHFNRPDLRRLLYLTLEGRFSQDAGDITNEGQVNYQPMSYDTHVVSWLKRVLPHIPAPQLVNILQQYISAITTL